MAVTQDDIDALQAAIWSGAREVKFGSGADSRTVTYRSLDEMRSILSDMQAALSGGAFNPVSYAAHSRY